MEEITDIPCHWIKDNDAHIMISPMVVYYHQCYPPIGAWSVTTHQWKVLPDLSVSMSHYEFSSRKINAK